jgi:hypothetical protein
MNAADLEALAQKIAAQTGRPVADARRALRIEMARLALALGVPAEKVSAYLATLAR